MASPVRALSFIVACALIFGTSACFARDEAPLRAERLVALAPASARERRFTELVLTRAQAISQALGPLLEDSGADVYIEFARPSQANYPQDGPAQYDPERHVLTFRRSLIDALDYDASYWARSYWPYYQQAELRATMPLIEVIDDALWLTHMQEAAHRKGLSWPHAGCASTSLAERLGCEMLLTAAHASVRSPQGLMFNTNRVDILWPDDLHELRSRAWRHDGVYREVQQLGGLLLVRPLVARFGAPRVLEYIAQTPFHIDGDNVRASAVSYQAEARRALEASALN
jgi:hypothetical protein